MARLPGPGWLLRVARDAAGFTFVEVLVASALLVLAVGALLPMLAIAQQTWDVAPRRATMIQNARAAVDRMVREMRAAQAFDALGTGALRFTMFAGGRSANPTMTVDYQLNVVNRDLEYRRDADPWQPLAGPFRSLSVTCFDSTNATIACAPASAVRSVQIALVVMDSQGVAPDITVSFRAYRQVP